MADGHTDGEQTIGDFIDNNATNLKIHEVIKIRKQEASLRRGYHFE